MTAQHTAKLLLLSGLTMTALTLGLTSHMPNAGIGHIGSTASEVARIAGHPHVLSSGSIGEIKVLRQPSAPAAIAHLILSLDQHLAGAIMTID